MSTKTKSHEHFANWFVYTCLVGLIPALARLFVWSVAKSGVEAFTISDLVAYGLVLHSANINEVSRIGQADATWKALLNGTSILFLVVYAVILGITILPDDRIDQRSLFQAVVSLTIISTMLSAAVLQRRTAVSSRSHK